MVERRVLDTLMGNTHPPIYGTKASKKGDPGVSSYVFHQKLPDGKVVRYVLPSFYDCWELNGGSLPNYEPSASCCFYYVLSLLKREKDIGGPQYEHMKPIEELNPKKFFIATCGVYQQLPERVSRMFDPVNRQLRKMGEKRVRAAWRF